VQFQETALMRAAEKGNIDCMRLLIDAGANKDAKNRVCVPLHCFAACAFVLSNHHLFFLVNT
jgi:ankyrin repeat protein